MFGCFLMAGLHEEHFLFLTGVCHGALSMCKHFCLEVCSGGGGGGSSGVIIDSSEACAYVIAFAWQASV